MATYKILQPLKLKTGFIVLDGEDELTQDLVKEGVLVEVDEKKAPEKKPVKPVKSVKSKG